METTTIAGARVSRVGLGTWAIGGQEWGAVPEQQAIELLLGALERGINLFDTAPIYGRFRSEELIGRAIRAHGRREDFYIATKAGLEWQGRTVYANSTPARLAEELEGSLRRLGTETIDLYQVHWPDTLIPIEETAQVFAGFLRSGKVRALGVSNFSVAQMQQFRSVAPLASLQPPYNLFERAIDSEILPWCHANGVAVLTWSSLCRSLLGGRITRTLSAEKSHVRGFDPKFQEPHFSQYMTAVERLTALARERFSRSLPQLAVRWVLDRPGVSVALWGASRLEQLSTVAGVMGWHIDADAMAEIDRILAESIADPVGPEYLTPRVRAAL
jgi:aryl-alcohol dehydrogenase-like predicted oxidoreductase